MQKEKISNISIKPIVVQKFDPSTVLGFEWFQNPYNTIAMIARTKSGKTTTIYNILEATLPKKAKVTIFCPSVKTDKTYKKMIKMMKKKDCIVETYPHFMDRNGSILDRIVDESEGTVTAKGKPQKPEELIAGQTLQDAMFNGIKKKKKKQEEDDDDDDTTDSKGKKLSAKHVLIIDDLSSACREKSLTKLLCKSRHLKMRIFISLHAITNLHPDGLRNVANLILFPNINKQKIEDVADKCGISFKQDSNKKSVLYDMYEDATSEAYNFLNIDRQEMTYRKNFNEMYKIDG